MMDSITLLLGLGNKVIDRVFPDETQAKQAKLELFKLKQSGELTQLLKQLEINHAEVANASVFVSGARPFIMWICGIGLAIQFLLAPLVTWGALLFHINLVLPSLDSGTLLTLLFGMLGLGGMRTVEKLNGVASK